MGNLLAAQRSLENFPYVVVKGHLIGHQIQEGGIVMANETASSVIPLPIPLRFDNPEDLIPKVRAQIKTVQANLSAARKDLSVESLTFGLEAPTEKGLDKAKLDPLLSTKVKPHCDRIALLDSWLKALNDLLGVFREAYKEPYLKSLIEEKDELVAACKKECQEPIAELEKEIAEIQRELDKVKPKRGA